MNYTGFRVATATGEQQYIKASTKYWSVAMFGGGGPLVVGRHDRPGRFEDGASPILKGHSGTVLDTEWSPFDDSMLATASEDCTIKFWSIPDDWEPTDENGMGKKGDDFSDSLMELDGHRKKVTLIRFHPTASNTILSSSADYTVKTWDIEAGSAISTLECSNLTQDIVWDVRGDSFATSNKDKSVRLIDARTGNETSKVDVAHEGTKSTKIQWLGPGKILTTGGSKQSMREMKVWDLKNLSKPLHTESVDTASGALMPFYDGDTGVIYLCGKGDGQIRLYEYDDAKAPYLFKLGGLDIMGCETVRLLKITNTDGIHPLKFYVPRKSEAFQDDIFPPAPSGAPAHTCAQWIGGSSKMPNTMALDPKSMAAAGVGGRANGKKTKLLTVPMMTKEAAKMKAHIESLEKKLKSNSISYDSYKSNL
jgi:coronin-1B/1C/6